MKQLASITSNLMKAQRNEKFIDGAEIILITGEPKYFVSNTRELVKQDNIEDYRFFASANDLSELIKELTDIKDSIEKN